MLSFMGVIATCSGDFQPLSSIQFIAADKGMQNGGGSSGTGAGEWGIWRKDPGPRGVRLKQYPTLAKNGGKAPAGWMFDPAD